MRLRGYREMEARGYEENAIPKAGSEMRSEHPLLASLTSLLGGLFTQHQHEESQEHIKMQLMLLRLRIEPDTSEKQGGTPTCRSQDAQMHTRGGPQRH